MKNERTKYGWRRAPRPFPSLLYSEQALGAHGFLRQGVALQNITQVVAIERMLDALSQPGAHLRLIAVADGLEQQILEADILEDLAQDVEDAPLSASLSTRSFPAAGKHVALAGLLGDQVPEVADLLLADAVMRPKRCSGRLGSMAGRN